MLVRLIQAISMLLSLLEWALVFRAILSWLQSIPVFSQLYQVAITFTEPIVSPVRNFLSRHFPSALAPVDFSLLGAMLMLELIRILL
jgi:uncharacterized protein YggT (Ycf19 family)